MSTSPIPKVRDDDPEDVSWALSTAQSQFARGDRVEALKWLRRAAESASEAEHDERALELAKAAADLSTANTAPPPVVKISPPAPAITPKASAVTTRPKPPASLATTKRNIDTKLKKSGAKPKADLREPLSSDDQTDTGMKPITATDADAWPTEAMAPSDLDSLHEVYGSERTRIGTAAYTPEEKSDGPNFRASQAVRVVVWRDGAGELRIAPFGTRVSAVTIEALLVAPGPDVDLLAWLSPA